MLFYPWLKNRDEDHIVLVNRRQWKQIHVAAANLIAQIGPDAPPWIQAAKEALARALSDEVPA